MPVSIPAPALRPAVTQKTAVPSPSILLVQKFLGFRQRGDAAHQYLLLSPATQAMRSAEAYAARPYKAPEVPYALVSPGFQEGLSKMTASLDALFFDPNGTLNYSYSIAGPAPHLKDAVLIRARSEGEASEIVPVVLVPPPDHSGVMRLDYRYSHLELMLMRRDEARARLCRSHLRILALAALQYTLDHGDRFPSADGWVGELLPYYIDWSLLHDPTDASGSPTSYRLNPYLSRFNLDRLKEPTKTPLFFETVPGRHDGGEYVAYADGKVSWRPSRMSAPSSAGLSKP